MSSTTNIRIGYIANVHTQGDPLRVRSTPNGAIVDHLPNGLLVYATGETIAASGRTWVSLGANQWVAADFLVPAANTIGKAKVIAIRTPRTFDGGLRVYRTHLVDGKNQVIQTVRGISGRVHRQVPSHVAGSQAPLPFGVYTFDKPGSVEFAPGEFGGVWSAVTPRFPTQRSGIGIHYDPSAFKQDSNTGTAGCFATPSIEERETMSRFIETYKPTHFVVVEGQ
jgi:hypothetical protein